MNRDATGLKDKSVTAHEVNNTNMKAGGYVILGYIDKTSKRCTVFNLTYQWNDIIDPNLSYDTDVIKSRFAKIVSFGQSKDYDIHITWSDKSIMIGKKFISGWLSSSEHEGGGGKW